jgi:TonB family protein
MPLTNPKHHHWCRRFPVFRTQVLVGLLVALGIGATGCAYFNTFYNAKQAFRKAAQETRKNRTGKPTSVENTNYQKAIEKAAKILDMYPRSRYVDDALFMMGQSYYHIQEYLQARRKFSDLLARNRDSDLGKEAALWLAKTDVALNDITTAEAELAELLNRNPSNRLKAESHYLLGKLGEKQKRYEEAVGYFRQSLEWASGDIKTDALFAVGVNLDTLGRYADAAKFFERVIKSNPEPTVLFDAEYRYAQMEKKQNNLDRAIRLFERLAGDEKNKTWIPDLKLQISECLWLKGDPEGSLITYQDITQENKKTRQSAQAYYAIGKIQETYKKDYNRALANYGQVGKEFSQSVFTDSADVKKRDILRLLALRQVIGMAVNSTGTDSLVITLEDIAKSVREEKEEQSSPDSSADGTRHPGPPGGESGNADSDSSMVETGSDTSLTEDRRPSREPSLPGNVRPQSSGRKTDVSNSELNSFRTEELDKNLFLLAELYLFRFSLPDSAVTTYQTLLSRFPESPYAPRALTNLAYVFSFLKGDSAAADTCHRAIVTKYPHSRYANPSRAVLGLDAVPSQEDSALVLFQRAERRLFEERNPKEALADYTRMIDEFPKSELVPKVRFSIAWIAENKLDSLSLAVALYDSVLRLHPGTPYAGEAAKNTQKLRTRINARSEKPKPVEPVSAAPDSSALKEPVRRPSQDASPDSVSKPDAGQGRESPSTVRAAPIGGIGAIQDRFSISDSIRQSLAKTSIQVQADVDSLGQVSRVQVLSSTANATVDSSVVGAVRAVRFRPEKKNGRPCSSSVVLTIPLTELD